MSKLLIHGKELYHYASPYYDPEKAHEYYEEHKKLKGRSSTAGLNEKGREVAQYVKKQINAERDENIKSESDKTKTEIKVNSEALKARVAQLRAQLKGMSKAQRSVNKNLIMNQIESLREDNKRRREELSEELKGTKTDLRENAKATYESELEKIKSNSQYLSTRKRKKK